MHTVVRSWTLLLSLCCFFFAGAIHATNAPSNLNATATSSSQVSLTWTDNSNNETGFTFMFDTNAAFTAPTYVWAGGANTTSYSHTGRSQATTYYYKIKAEAEPDSAWTSTGSATTAPAALAASATSNSALSLSWSGNANNANVTGYTYAYATNSSFNGAAYVWVAGNGATSASRSGLSTATTYWVKIKAEGATDALDSPFGYVVAATTTPSSLAASAVSSSQVNLSWSGNGGNTNIVGYTIAKATNAAFTGATYHYVNGAGATSYSSTGLSPNTTYYFKVKAEGTADGYDSPFTSPVTAATATAAPNPPSGLAASVISSSRIDLSWIDNSNDETAFELKRATDSAFTQNVIWIGGIQGTTYANSGLTASTTYYYKVRAKGAVQDSVYSNTASATTTPSSGIPEPPSGLTATAVSSSRVNLSWTDNSNNETGFELKRATDSAFTQNVVWIGSITGPTYGNTGLSPSTTYYYKLRAEGSAGKSAYSNTVSVTTPGPPPPPSGAVPISPRLFGVNAWMPEYVGEAHPNGQLTAKWPKVQQSGARIVRYGGIAVDEAKPGWVDGNPPPPDACPPDPSRESTTKQYVEMIDAMRGIGVEPILQVPVLANTYTEQQAAALVQCINITLQKGVKYWSIGNEPDNEWGFDAEKVSDYMIRFAAAMKAKDPTIRIVGPDTAWYNDRILDSLICGTYDITMKVPNKNYYYLDVVAFHSYGFPDKDSNGNLVWPTRAGVIGELESGLQADLLDLKPKVATCNGARGRTGGEALTIAVTEANINWQNPGNDGLDGVGAKSFLGGQFWAEMLGIAMQQGVDFLNFWSVIEGSSVAQDKGYLSRDGTTIHPSYHHFKMMADHFRGYSLASTDNWPNVKTFAAKDVDQIVVILLNQDASTDFGYTVGLNNDASTGTLQVDVPAGVVAPMSTGTIARQSTTLLVFDAGGTLKKKIEYKRNPGATPTMDELNY